MNIRRPLPYREYNLVFVLIGINILVFLAQMRFGLVIAANFSMRPVDIMFRQTYWQFITYMFIHGGFSHLFFNMFALFIFGRHVEYRMGSFEFLLYYLVTGALAGVFSFFVYWFTGNPGVYLMGASGAIFAVQLSYAAIFPQSKIYIWGILPVKAPILVLGFTALEVFFILTGASRGVAHITHLAGFAFGWLYFVVRFGVNPWKMMRS